MSRETAVWLNTNTLIGFADKRGHAWHYRADAQGDEPNHYNGAIPVGDVQRRLFHWEAQSVPLEVTMLTEHGVTVVSDPTRQVIVRPDTATVLGVFKSGYQIHSYDEWLIRNVSTILGDTLSIGSAGLLKGGAVAWVSVEVPDTIKTPEGVEFRPNLLACTSMDGSLATTYKRVVTNVVCDNTMAVGLGEKGQQFKIKHSAKSLNKIAEAQDALAIVHHISEDFEAEVQRLCQIEVTQSAWARFLDAHAPVDPDASQRSKTMAENKRDDFNRLWNHDERVSPWRNTAWGVVQADNTYRHHLQTVRGTTRTERNGLNALNGSTEADDAAVLGTLNKVLALA